MNTGNYKRVLASAAVLGVAVVGPMAAPAQAAPGGNAGHAKSGHAKSGHASKGHSSSGGSAASRSNGHGHGNGHAKGHGNTGGGSAPAGPPSRTPANNGRKADKGDKGGKGANGGKDGKGGDPAGNNGTVKIETSPAGKDAPNNVPHVGCTFQIEWYGFDEGADIISTVGFQMHSPTKDVILGGTEPSKVFVGGDPASGAGTDSGLDGVQEYTLSFDGEPHAQQGYHVKLTIHTPGSQGADTKHKVFWVEPCEEQPPGGPPPGGPPEVEGDQKTAKDHEVEVAGKDHEVEVAGKQQVARTSVSPSDVPTAVNAGAAGAPIGTSPLAHLIVTLGGLLAALGFLLRRRTA